MPKLLQDLRGQVIFALATNTSGSWFPNPDFSLIRLEPVLLLHILHHILELKKFATDRDPSRHDQKWASMATEAAAVTPTEFRTSSADMGEPAGGTKISPALHGSTWYRVARREATLSWRHSTACLEFANQAFQGRWYCTLSSPLISKWWHAHAQTCGYI